MKPLNNSIARVLISTEPKLGKIRNYIFRHKQYIDWISFLQFGLQKLLEENQLNENEKIVVFKARKLIKRFNKVKRPAQFLKSHLSELRPPIEILLNYE